jgi:hypothetical protein
VFYVWHDELAGQLRSNTTSVPADQLPFGIPVVPTALEKIVEGYLRSPGFIPWTDLKPAARPQDQQELVVEVWSVDVA